MAAGGQNILFRVDASQHIGTGHVMRCLTLAQALKSDGANCLFVCRAHEGNLLDYIAAQGFEVRPLPFSPSSGDSHAGWLGCDWQTDAAQTRAAIGEARFEWLIVDHYALDSGWETAMQSVFERLMVIDDLADRPHVCEVLLDQNLGRERADYRTRVGPDCTLLLGPEFALLRPEFAEWRVQSLRRRAASTGLKTLLITMGGVDQHNVTSQILTALKGCALPEELQIQVIMGPHAPWLAEVESEANSMPWPTQVLVGVSNMAELMTKADLAIGAAGSTSWERCCLGLPTLALVLADNQLEAAQHLEKAGAIVLLGNTEANDWQLRLTEIVATLAAKTLTVLSQNARAIADGGGAAKCLNALRL